MILIILRQYFFFSTLFTWFYQFPFLAADSPITFDEAFRQILYIFGKFLFTMFMLEFLLQFLPPSYLRDVLSACFFGAFGTSDHLGQRNPDFKVKA